MEKNYIHIILLFICLSFLPSKNASAQCIFTGPMPYYEGFNSLTANNQLPTCWAASSMSTACLSFSNTLNCAAFASSVQGTHYFYSNGIQLQTGITYSVSTWYKNSSPGTNFSNASLLIGSSQSSTGLSPLVTSAGTNSNTVFVSLSTTFSVASSGIYYFSLAATASTGASQYLYFDDFQINVPCNFSPNSPTLTFNSSSAQTVCAGTSVTLTANGADTYTWSNTTSGSVNVVSPSSNISIAVSGTKTLTGCVSIVIYTLVVLPTPVVAVLALPPIVCIGSTVGLVATGAGTYSLNGSPITIPYIFTPTASASYTIQGTSASNTCTSKAALTISVVPLPIIGATVNPIFICPGESATLSASGALTYSWSNGSSTSNNNPYPLNPMGSATYTVTGFDVNGCKNTNTVALSVSPCTGLQAVTSETTTFLVYPNPSNGELNITGAKGMELIVFNQLGEVVFTQTIKSESCILNLKSRGRGVYLINARDSAFNLNKKIIITD